MLGKTSYLCNFVKIKGKSIFPLRGAQVNSNFVACVKDRIGIPQRSEELQRIACLDAQIEKDYG